MCPKLFILKEFYFLILETNVRSFINIHPCELLSTKIKESRINESQKKKKKCFTIILKKWKIYILYLIISLQIFFKEITKYKNDYQ